MTGINAPCPLARTGGAGLDLADSAERLAFAATLPETRAADDILALVRSGVMRGASVEMRVTAERVEAGVRVIGTGRRCLASPWSTRRPIRGQAKWKRAGRDHQDAAPKRRRWYF